MIDLETHFIEFSTKGHTDIIDLSDRLDDLIAHSDFEEGQVTVFGIGSTTGITTIEYEPGLVNQDVAKMLDKIAPYGHGYAHNQTWGDDNGAAHLRSMTIGTSMALPFKAGTLLTGTWQQVVFIDFDTRPRSRRVAVQLFGKKGE